jgi:hypothetical protein
LPVVLLRNGQGHQVHVESNDDKRKHRSPFQVECGNRAAPGNLVFRVHRSGHDSGCTTNPIQGRKVSGFAGTSNQRPARNRNRLSGLGFVIDILPMSISSGEHGPAESQWAAIVTPRRHPQGTTRNQQMAKVRGYGADMLWRRGSSNSDDIEKERCDSKRALMLT